MAFFSHMPRTSLCGHVQSCDWGGEISFEEARWAQLQAAAAGRPPAALAAELAAAAAAQNRLYQVLAWRIMQSEPL